MRLHPHDLTNTRSARHVESDAKAQARSRAQLRPSVAIRQYHDRALERLLTCADDDESADRIKGHANELTTALAPFIHKQVYGCLPGLERSIFAALMRIVEAHLAGKVIVKFDFRTAYESVNCDALLTDVRPHLTPKQMVGVSPRVNDGYYVPRIEGRGLPTGLATSPILWGAYISRRLGALLDRYDVVLYIDDGFAFFDTNQEARAFVRALRLHLKTHGKGVALSEKPKKRIAIIPPGGRVDALGINLDANRILCGDSAWHYLLVVRHIALSKAGSAVAFSAHLRELLPITTFSPSGPSFFSEHSGLGVERSVHPEDPFPAPGKRFQEHWQLGSQPLSWQERTIVFERLADEFKEFGPQGRHYAAASRLRPEPLTPRGARASDGVDRAIVSTQSTSQRNTRRWTGYSLTDDDGRSAIARMYKGWSSARPAYGYVPRHEGAYIVSPAIHAADQDGKFFALLHELWARLIAFNQSDMLTLTYFGIRFRKPMTHCERKWVLHLFYNELRVINQSWWFEEAANHLESADLSLKRIQQYLRGLAIWRAMELWTASEVPCRGWMLRTVGTLTSPNDFEELKGLIEAARKSHLSRPKFDERIKAIAKRGGASC